MSCAECVGDLDHCHGTLVVGDDDALECTDGCVDLGRERHDLVVAAGG